MPWGQNAQIKCMDTVIAMTGKRTCHLTNIIQPFYLFCKRVSMPGRNKADFAALMCQVFVDFFDCIACTFACNKIRILLISHRHKIKHGSFLRNYRVLVDLNGIEPSTSRMRTERSPS